MMMSLSNGFYATQSTLLEFTCNWKKDVKVGREMFNELLMHRM